MERTEDYGKGLNSLPTFDVLKFYAEDCSVVIRPSGAELKLKVYVSVAAEGGTLGQLIEQNIYCTPQTFTVIGVAVFSFIGTS